MFRPLRRKERQLPAEDCERILSTAPRGVLSVLGDDGYPYGIPLDFVLFGGKLYFHCAREGHKLDAIAACDKACFTVMGEPVPEPNDWWYHVESVVCFGRARVVSPDEDVWPPALQALGHKYFPPEKSVDASIARSGSRVALIELTIEHLSGKHVHEK